MPKRRDCGGFGLLKYNTSYEMGPDSGCVCAYSAPPRPLAGREGCTLPRMMGVVAPPPAVPNFFTLPTPLCELRLNIGHLCIRDSVGAEPDIKGAWVTYKSFHRNGKMSAVFVSDQGSWPFTWLATSSMQVLMDVVKLSF